MERLETSVKEAREIHNFEEAETLQKGDLFYAEEIRISEPDVFVERGLSRTFGGKPYHLGIQWVHKGLMMATEHVFSDGSYQFVTTRVELPSPTGRLHATNLAKYLEYRDILIKSGFPEPESQAAA